MKTTLLSLLCALALVPCSWGKTRAGNTYTAASCAEPDVAAAVAKASNGDTVVIPTCTATSGTPGVGNDWNTRLVVNAGITLTGQGPRQTVLIDDVSKKKCNANGNLMFIDVTSNVPWTLKNFSVQGSAPDKGECAEHIKVVTNSHAFRITNLVMNNLQSTGIQLDGDEWGVIDHSTFNSSPHQQRAIDVHHDQWQQMGAHGDNSWAQPDTMGAVGYPANPDADNAGAGVFVENNIFNIANDQADANVSCEYGAREVVRFNQLNKLGSHGTDTTARWRSCRHREVYGNTFRDLGYSGVTQGDQLRGGTELYFNNTFCPSSGGNYASLLALETYREVDRWKPWRSASGIKEACDGAALFDNNSSTVYYSGTMTAVGTVSGGTNTLTDKGAKWTPNQWAGSSTSGGDYAIRDVTQGFGYPIRSNSSNQITFWVSSQGSQPKTFTVGDTYQILSVYPCLDQVGRGRGTYLSGSPPRPAEWPAEAPDPVYAWGNTRTAVGAQCTLGAGTNVASIGAYYEHVKQNRDWYDDDLGPGNGTGGTGVGTLAQRPTTCTPYAGYWATDANQGNGVLYQCTASNTWTAYYTPYVYPYPLDVPDPPRGVVAVAH
jgi:hypothetical protein